MASRKDIVAGGAAVEIRAIDQATKVVRDVAGGFVDAGQKIAAMGMKAVAAAAAATTAIVALSVVTASWAASVDDAAKRTGVSAEALQELRYGAEQSGANFDDLVAGIRNMNKELAGSSASDMLESIGIRLADLQNLTPDQRFIAIAEALARIPDAARQTEAAMGIFGKGGFALLPFLQEGSKGINQFREDAKRLGLVLSSDVVSNFAAYDDVVARITSSTKAISSLLAASFLPILQPIGDVVVGITSAFAGWIAQNQEVGAMLATVIAVVGGVGAGMIFLGTVLAGPISLLASLATVAGGFIAIFGGWAAGVAAVGVGIGLVLGVVAALAAAFALTSFATMDFDEALNSSSEALSRWWKWLQEIQQGLVDRFGPAIKGIVDAIRENDFYSAAKLAFMGLQIASTEVFQWLFGFAIQRMRDFANLILVPLKQVLGGIPGVAEQIDAQLAGINSKVVENTLNGVLEGQRKKLQDEIAKINKQVEVKRDARVLAEEVAADEQNFKDVQAQAEKFAGDMRQYTEAQPKTGYEPGADRNMTVGTAASGVAGMIVAPMTGAMQPVVAALDKQLEVQNKIEQNTKFGPTFGA